MHSSIFHKSLGNIVDNWNVEEYMNCFTSHIHGIVHSIPHSYIPYHCGKLNVEEYIYIYSFTLQIYAIII